MVACGAFDALGATMTTPTLHCSVCGGLTSSAGAVDFNKSGADWFEGERQFPVSEEVVAYRRCRDCGFMFTPYFDEWSEADFQARVYNASYVVADPPFLAERPSRLAAYLSCVLGDALGEVSLLDFGAGEGRMVAELRRLGLAHGTSYDPYHVDTPLPEGQHELVTAFEVVEHVPAQGELFDRLCGLVAPGGMLLLSTLLQPEDIGSIGAKWWYACPRNGHLAFHTAQSLSTLLETRGFTLVSLSAELHMASKGPARLLRRFQESEQTLEVSGAHSSDPAPRRADGSPSTGTGGTVKRPGADDRCYGPLHE